MSGHEGRLEKEKGEWMEPSSAQSKTGIEFLYQKRATQEQIEKGKCAHEKGRDTPKSQA
jgi:hypothetical protein